MLHQELIAIGKVGNAFDLNTIEIVEVIKNLRPYIAPYAIWQKTYDVYWKDIVVNTAQKHSLPIPTLPENIHTDFTPYEIDENIFSFISKILPLAEERAIQDGLDYIFLETYDTIPDRVSWWIERFKNNVPFIAKLENEPYLEQIAINNNTFSMKTLLEFMEGAFQDTFAINKKAVVQYLVACGYPFKQEVKGLSKGFFDYVTAQTFPMPTTTVPSDAASLTESKECNLCVPRHLWEGKTPMAVRDSMREANFDDAVIAHVLYFWCGQNNKTYVGKLLGTAHKEDSTYRKFCHRLLEKAQALYITTR